MTAATFQYPTIMQPPPEAMLPGPEITNAWSPMLEMTRPAPTLEPVPRMEMSNPTSLYLQTTTTGDAHQFNEVLAGQLNAPARNDIDLFHHGFVPPLVSLPILTDVALAAGIREMTTRAADPVAAGLQELATEYTIPDPVAIDDPRFDPVFAPQFGMEMSGPRDALLVTDDISKSFRILLRDDTPDDPETTLFVDGTPEFE